MAAETKIEWAANADGSPGATWNPIRARFRDHSILGDAGEERIGTHCVHVSEGCRNCYAERFNLRALPGAGTGLPYTKQSEAKIQIFLDQDKLAAPLRRRKPTTWFLSSMTDVFADFVTDGMIMRLWEVMFRCPQHTFIVLTKRPERMRDFCTRFADVDAEDATQFKSARGPDAVRAAHPSPRGQLFAAMMDQLLVDAGGEIPAGAAFPTFDWMGGMMWWPAWPPNVWLVVSAEDQATANERIPHLLATPAAVRGVSCEPMLGAIDLDQAWNGESALDSECWGECNWCAQGLPPLHNCQRHASAFTNLRSGIDWVICGGESGPNARPMHPDWARLLRDQCAAAGVPFFFKQWGEWAPHDAHEDMPKHYVGRNGGIYSAGDLEADFGVLKLGKARAGRLLGGVEHNGRPKL